MFVVKPYAFYIHNNYVSTNILILDTNMIKLVLKPLHSLSALFYRNQNGSWSDDGVYITDIAKEHILCSSDHLTSFAVLATRRVS